MRSDEDFVFYNQPRHPGGQVWRLGKKRADGGLTDTIQTDLAGVESGVGRILLVASADGVTFDRVRDLRILLYDAQSADGEALAYFDIKPETGEETALICGELYRRGDGWKFRALGEGYSNGLKGLATDFGISVDESEAAQQPDPPRSPPSSRPRRRTYRPPTGRRHCPGRRPRPSRRCRRCPGRCRPSSRRGARAARVRLPAAAARGHPAGLRLSAAGRRSARLRLSPAGRRRAVRIRLPAARRPARRRPGLPAAAAGAAVHRTLTTHGAFESKACSAAGLGLEAPPH
ncbi:hypothetical protein SHKM778_75070 [Streptomyces sp. KM77-8]|uniref:TerD domain-containing protein n=1 Tax=Streptomyces haneummycinicus TaxID=3074435 RepID=A0AAT9HV13_9ACTN